MPKWPAIDTNPHYDELTAFVGHVQDLETGELKPERMTGPIAEAIAEEAAVVAAAAAAAETAVANELEDLDIAGAVTPGDEGDIKKTVGGAVVNARHTAHHGITVAAADSPQWLKDMADFHPGMSGSDSAHLQAAIDQAEDFPSVFYAGGAPPVLLAAGNHNWDSTVTKRTSAIMSIGEGSLPVTVRWQGTPGETAMNVQDYSTSFGRISGMRFIAGGEDDDNHPGHWIDFTEVNLLDVFMSLEWLHFEGGEIPIKTGTWVNIHWKHLRFDAWIDVAVELNPGELQFASSFSLDQFTADNGPLGTTASNNAFMRIVMPPTGNVYHGVVGLSNARIEYNRELLPGPGGIIICQYAEPSFSDVTLSLENIAVQDQVGSANSNMIYVDSPEGVQNPPTSRGFGVFTEGLQGKVYAGDIPSWSGNPDLTNLQTVDWAAMGRQSVAETRSMRAGAADWATDESYVGEEEAPRHQRDAHGNYTWVNGATLSPTDGDVGLTLGGGPIRTENWFQAEWGFVIPGGQSYEGHFSMGPVHLWRSWNNLPMVGAEPIESDASGQTFSSVPYSTRVVTASATLTALDSVVLVDATAGAVTITLPGIATLSDGTTFRIKKIDSGANAVTVDGNASETLDGQLSIALAAQYDYLVITAANGNFYVFGGNV